MKINYTILADILLIIVGVVFLISGINDFKDYYNRSHPSDAALFHLSYTSVLEKDAKYEYIKLNKINNILNENVIIFAGNTKDAFSQILAKPLNDIMLEKDEKIYYLELDNIDTKNTKYSEFLQKINTEKLSTPSIIVKKDNNIKVITKNDWFNKEYDGILVEYFDEEQIDNLKKLIIDVQA